MNNHYCTSIVNFYDVNDQLIKQKAYTLPHSEMQNLKEIAKKDMPPGGYDVFVYITYHTEDEGIAYEIYDLIDDILSFCFIIKHEDETDEDSISRFSKFKRSRNG